MSDTTRRQRAEQFEWPYSGFWVDVMTEFAAAEVARALSGLSAPISLLMNRLVLASIAKGQNVDVPEDQITDADLEQIKRKVLDLLVVRHE